MPDFIKRLLTRHKWVKSGENRRRCSVCGREDVTEYAPESSGPSYETTVRREGDYRLHWPMKA